ncbi:shikimate dehydrogenase [Candidatus Uhrbacteria bacterium RIFCSPHIGHO2_12_FULL_54_23]|uniref:Shikimate dehydrogenase (NADP(+)) n=3 Tax=Candidatus Uhriibacteriota TaxID=1752732 RepID=A0A1F7ULV1_9BACT|nr:MAG: shikimate dehydrogenase [Candidatus Uhrbacteria bacterium RIFCSPHIGHO2_12_FULL_54_23]OGL84022.1 MAG: shikimate dehydrogenase [Candidatus Uhrbacteria bacterium RIFCSPLOWO2_01_FULL_55_36]OGL90670.1 MAG: shikimate dehydrogenase [Candidatus Uhrbacteria bacterium RIFCSPLOWO2_02_FULL_54_37]
MKVTAHTQIFGIIGDPVDHSLSPLLHNAAFEALGLDYVFLAFPVQDVEAAVRGVRALGLRGVNVTVPHKQTVIPFLDEVEEEARTIGAVNTIVNEGGKLKGYNTDAPGFMTALTKKAGEVRGKRVIVLGAGGAARAAVYGLVRAGAQVVVFNRTREHAELLIKELGGKAEGIDTLAQAIASADIVVNATSVGLHGVHESPIPKDLLRKDLIVFDLVYYKGGTQLIKDAMVIGCTAIIGNELLLEQAFLAFKLFTELNAPVEVMRKAHEDNIVNLGSMPA